MRILYVSSRSGPTSAWSDPGGEPIELVHERSLERAAARLGDERVDAVVVDAAVAAAAVGALDRLERVAGIPLLLAVDGDIADGVNGEASGADGVLPRGASPAEQSRLLTEAVERSRLAAELERTRRALSRSEARFRDVIEGMADAVVVVDPHGVVRFANGRARRLFGRDGAPLVGSPFGHPMVAGESAEIDVVRPGSSPLVMEMRVVESEWEGAVACLATFRDVTARKQAEAHARELVREQAARTAAEASARRFRFLAESASVLASTLDYEATIARLARLCVSELADWVIIYGADGAGRVHRLEAAHRDPSKAELIRELRASFIDPDGPNPVLEVLRTGRARLDAEVTAEDLASISQDPRHAELLRALGVSSFILAPLVARGRRLGAIALVSSDPGRRYGREELELAEDLASRAALAADNARLYQEAHQATQAKSDLLAVISHDLRTPLNSIIGYAELLSMGVPEPLADGPRERVERIRAGARHLLQLINQLLELSRLEAGREELRLDDVDLAALAREVAVVMEPLAGERGLRLRLDVPDSEAPFRTDPEKLRQVLTNLAANAVKFTDSGEVRLELRRGAGGDVVLRISDTGPGIAAGDLDRIFEPFWRAPEGRATASGTGLGLAVVRRLVDLMGGRIQVASRVGEGSVFTVTLPAEPPSAPAASPAPVPPTALPPGSAVAEEDRFGRLIQNTADGVVVVDGDGRVRFANPSAERLFGVPPGGLAGHEFGFPIVADATTEIDIVAGGAGRVAELRVVEGEWEGEPAHVVSLRDITDRREAEARRRALVREQTARSAAEESARRAAFLYEAGTRLASSLDLESMLRAVVDLVVAEFADVCTLDIRLDGRVKRLAGTRADVPASVVRAMRAAGEHPLDPDSDSPQARVHREREPLLVRDVTDEWLREATRGPAHLEAARAAGVRSLVCVPLAAGDESLGVLTAARRGAPAFTDADLLTAAELGRRAAVALEQARLYRELEAASRAKTDFLAVASHELRTPLSAIIGYTGLMERGVGGDPSDDHRRFIERIQTSSAELLKIIDQILVFVSADAGRSSARPEPATVGELVDAVASLVEPVARDAGLDFRVDMADPDAVVETDAGKVRQVLMHLLSNAVKFTPEGLIELSARVDEEEARFAVRDTGVGIAPDQHQAVFEQFWQRENPLTRRAGGMGLGLTVADRLARLLGGRIELESREGAGSTFTLCIPRRPEG